MAYKNRHCKSRENVMAGDPRNEN
ncbi:MAG: hypothetical protein JWN93_597, partial [Hyphomicrobiales bacterium]|nr:hypothetical protein [Hyphomicrobiales bacterium]